MEKQSMFMSQELQHRRWIAVGGIGILLVLLLVAVAGYWRLTLGWTPPLDDFGAAPAFTLTDQLERPVSSDEFKEQVVVANFVYTTCQDICPLLSVQMQELQERLRQEQLLGSDVQLLSFSVDPARDTPAVLRAYAERHRADPSAWRFLTGPTDTLVPLIVEGFHLGVQALPPPDATHSAHGDSADSDKQYEVTHSGRFVLIDRQGRIRAYYSGDDFDPKRVVGDIRALLR